MVETAIVEHHCARLYALLTLKNILKKTRIFCCLVMNVAILCRSWFFTQHMQNTHLARLLLVETANWLLTGVMVKKDATKVCALLFASHFIFYTTTHYHIEAETRWTPFHRRVQMHFLEWKIPIKISLKFVPQGPFNNIPALVQVMAWCRPGNKPLSEPMMVSLPTHICVTRPQWVNTNVYFTCVLKIVW